MIADFKLTEGGESRYQEMGLSRQESIKKLRLELQVAWYYFIWRQQSLNL
jgi:hypothetical protein